MPQQKNLIIVLSSVIVLLLGVVLYQADFWPAGGNNATSTATTTDMVEGEEVEEAAGAKVTTTAKPAVKTTTQAPSAGYISLAYSTARDAVFNLHTSVNDADIKNGKNMELCVLTSATAPCNGDLLTYGEGFKIEYTEAASVLKISDVSGLNERRPDLLSGAFKPNCTGCSVYVEFSSIRNEYGIVLPTKRVLIRAQ